MAYDSQGCLFVLGYQSDLMFSAQSRLLTEPIFCVFSFLGSCTVGHDPSSTGRSARHKDRLVACALCLDASSSDEICHVQIGGIFDRFVDVIELARIAFSCDFALDLLCSKEGAHDSA